jgi:8-hydroxy-5-deazaflavin:NADPH oxidoreductase
MRVAVIGAGNVGKALGEALAAKGQDVVYGVRDLKKSDAKPAETVEKAIAGADAIILATPYDVTGPLLRKHAAVLAGRW